MTPYHCGHGYLFKNFIKTDRRIGLLPRKFKNQRPIELSRFTKRKSEERRDTGCQKLIDKSILTLYLGCILFDTFTIFKIEIFRYITDIDRSLGTSLYTYTFTQTYILHLKIVPKTFISSLLIFDSRRFLRKYLFTTLIIHSVISYCILLLIYLI